MNECLLHVYLVVVIVLVRCVVVVELLVVKARDLEACEDAQSEEAQHQLHVDEYGVHKLKSELHGQQIGDLEWRRLRVDGQPHDGEEKDAQRRLDHEREQPEAGQLGNLFRFSLCKFTILQCFNVLMYIYKYTVCTRSLRLPT